MNKPAFLLIIILLAGTQAFSQLIEPDKENLMPELRNCQGSMMMVTFQTQLNVLKHCVLGETTLATQKVIHFSRDYKVDTAWFNQQIAKVRKTLPASYFRKIGVSGGWYDNNPDEKAIWFILIFAHLNKDGTFKPYSAIEVYFEGDDARIDEQRINPAIRDVRFVFDAARLKELLQKLKTAHRVSG